MSENTYRVVVHLPKADGFHDRTDQGLAYEVEKAVQEGLADRYVKFDYTSVEKVPPLTPYATIPVGTKVVVTPHRSEEQEPWTGRVVGYDIHRSKYRLDRQVDEDYWSKGGLYWAFTGQVELHPDEITEES